jgi:hypothetical protein
MHPIAIELPFMATAAAIMASIVLIGGTSIEVPAQPIVLPSQQAEWARNTADGCLEAPVTAPAGILGRGTLCESGQDLRVLLQASGLTSGERYAAWLSYTLETRPCRDTPCGSLDLPGENPASLMRQIGEGVAPASRTVEFDVTLDHVRLVTDAHVALVLSVLR